jgi:hypothetical protein
MLNKVTQIKTSGDTHLVVRDAKGRKLFDVDAPGLTIVVAVPDTAEIRIQPAPVTRTGKHI